MRGERLRRADLASSFSGSSPHARGTLSPVPSYDVERRFIPACAGNAFGSSDSCGNQEVHPRMRGERENRFSIAPNIFGSSPHARGTLNRHMAGEFRKRFIPACAGNAATAANASARTSVHPRMRGERASFSRWILTKIGSSPHARGTLPYKEKEEAKARFIPACAGNASVWAVSRSRRSVHPRMRGEREISRRLRGFAVGSSPHARGTPSRLQSCTDARRFIPACAGNADPVKPDAGDDAVHPRMRGERLISPQAISDVLGSSPHARGTRRRFWQWSHTSRFIPACAGNAAAPQEQDRRVSVHPRMRGERRSGRPFLRTRSGSSPHARGTRGQRGRQPRGATVHPRMRGERPASISDARARFGSSPHARGTPQNGGRLIRIDRFIPACAGNAPKAEPA